jgi:hypothetical protein
MRLQGFPVTREAIQIKGQEIARSLNISEDHFKGSMGWCKRMMRRNGLALRQNNYQRSLMKNCYHFNGILYAAKNTITP